MGFTNQKLCNAPLQAGERRENSNRIKRCIRCNEWRDRPISKKLFDVDRTKKKTKLFMNTIKNVIFDLGGVLIDWNPAYVYLEVFDGDQKNAMVF